MIDMNKLTRTLRILLIPVLVSCTVTARSEFPGRTTQSPDDPSFHHPMLGESVFLFGPDMEMEKIQVPDYLKINK